VQKKGSTQCDERWREEVIVVLTVFLGSLLLVAVVEFFWPRRRREFPALRRRLGNIGFWLLNLILAAFVFDPPAMFRPQLEAVTGIVFPAWPLFDTALSLSVGFVLLDLLRYGVHRCKHAVPFLWRFHALHHSDPDLDVTTSVRQHPGEYLFGSAILWSTVIAFNIPPVLWLSYGIAVFVTEAVQHGNVRLPEWLERALQPVLATVDMHRIHHSVVFEQANSNYGAVLSIWDRLFGTYTSISRAEHERVIFGVRELRRSECLKPSAMLLTPWRIPRVVAIE
jgi:sterol desaturase/sphingolipid hydroxylase (fatty acid hydroxylase superfamily)